MGYFLHWLQPFAGVVISSSSSENVNDAALNETSCRRGRPRRTPRLNVDDDDDASQLLSIDEYNVGPVLERLLAMMQSMTMLLSALKNDLRHTNVPEVVARKRDAATAQLWRAFVAYHKSFAEIEEFASLSMTSGQTPNKSLGVTVINLPSQSHVNQDVAAKTKRRSECLHVREADVIELSESEDEDEVECKRAHDDSAETAVQQSVPVSVSSATVQLQTAHQL